MRLLMRGRWVGGGGRTSEQLTLTLGGWAGFGVGTNSMLQLTPEAFAVSPNAVCQLSCRLRTQHS